MQAIILAGGFGTRLRTVVNDRPKPMALINNKPFLEYLMDKLSEEGFTRVVFAVGYMHEMIEDHFKDKYKNIEVMYSLEEEPLGTGGCIKKAMEYLTDEYVYVLNGDTFFDVDLPKMKTTNDIMIACKYMENFSRYGKVSISDDERIIAFNEKMPNQTGYINGGIYLMKLNIFDKFNLDEKFSLETDFFNPYINTLKIDAYKSNDYFMDIGIPEDYYQFCKDKAIKALFLDRDGVINNDFGHVYKKDDFKFLPYIFDLCKKYQNDGYKIIVISNQAGIAKGLYTENDLVIIDKYMKDEFKKNGVDILDSFYCPHRDEDNCSCRKPKPGLIIKAAQKYGIDLEQSVLIGDKMSDLEAGYNAGIKELYFKKGRYEEKKVNFDYKLLKD